MSRAGGNLGASHEDRAPAPATGLVSATVGKTEVSLHLTEPSKLSRQIDERGGDEVNHFTFPLDTSLNLQHR